MGRGPGARLGPAWGLGLEISHERWGQPASTRCRAGVEPCEGWGLRGLLNTKVRDCFTCDTNRLECGIRRPRTRWWVSPRPRTWMCPTTLDPSARQPMHVSSAVIVNETVSVNVNESLVTDSSFIATLCAFRCPQEPDHPNPDDVGEPKKGKAVAAGCRPKSRAKPKAKSKAHNNRWHAQVMRREPGSLLHEFRLRLQLARTNPKPSRNRAARSGRTRGLGRLAAVLLVNRSDSSAAT